MLDRIVRCLRLIGIGASFFAIGFGGILIAPALIVLLRRRALRTAVARSFIRFTFRSIVAVMWGCGVFRYEIRGLERLRRRGLLILANHPSLVDIVFLIAFVEQADCIVKSGLWRNPFTAATIQAAGYIRNDSGPELIEHCIASLSAGGNLIVFPEGTRTPPDGSITLRRGAANIAVRAGRDITPVVIQCTPPIVGKGMQFLRALSRSIHYQIEVKEDIEVRPFIAQAAGDALAARRLTHYLQDYFTGEKRYHAVA